MVLWATGRLAKVLLDDHVQLATVPGSWRLTYHHVRPLAPGDNVQLRWDKTGYIITDRLPRRNEFTRRESGLRPCPQTIAVNLDLCCIIASINEPVTPFGLVDRLLVAAEFGGVKPILVVNKTDRGSTEVERLWTANYHAAVEQILFTSTKTQRGIQLLADTIREKVVLFAGSSGVGKSSLANIIDPNLNLKANIVSTVTGKGKHTTTASILHPVAQGGWIADTPGLRECAPWEMTPEKLAAAFPEIEQLAGTCHYRNCRHDSESQCPVKQIAGTDAFPAERYASYLKLLGESRPNESI